MSVESFEEVPLEAFGSWVTNVDPSDLAPGLSPDVADVEYFPGGCRTRPGTLAAFAAIAGVTPSINGVKSFITLALAQKVLVFTSDGQLLKGPPNGALAALRIGLPGSSFMASCTAFGAEYIGISDGSDRQLPAAGARRHQHRPGLDGWPRQPAPPWRRPRPRT
jgi:hypothetical protein